MDHVTIFFLALFAPPTIWTLAFGVFEYINPPDPYDKWRWTEVYVAGWVFSFWVGMIVTELFVKQ